MPLPRMALADVWPDATPAPAPPARAARRRPQDDGARGPARRGGDAGPGRAGPRADALRLVRSPTASARRSSAASSPGRRASRSGSCGRAASADLRPVRRAVGQPPRVRAHPRRRGRHRRARRPPRPADRRPAPGRPAARHDGGRAVYDRADDREGFSAGSSQFDSDITASRHPRAALALAGDAVLAVACDGRSRADAGLTLEEFASVLVELGAAQRHQPRRRRLHVARRRRPPAQPPATRTRASRSAAAARSRPRSSSSPPRAGEGARTPDLRFTRALLYQLSYSGRRPRV